MTNGAVGAAWVRFRSLIVSLGGTNDERSGWGTLGEADTRLRRDSASRRCLAWSGARQARTRPFGVDSQAGGGIRSSSRQGPSPAIGWVRPFSQSAWRSS